MDIHMERVRKKDADLIPELIRFGMDEALFQMTIFSCEGYATFIRHVIENNNPTNSMQFYGLYKKEKLIGFTEWRTWQEGLFLNNIHVHPTYRGLGLGKEMLENHGLQLLQEQGKSRLLLDVFAHNDGALSWYKKIGFQKTTKMIWYDEQVSHFLDGALQQQEKGVVLITKSNVENDIQANDMHRMYGFSTLHISTEIGTYEIGRINDKYYRLQDVAALSDAMLLQRLQQLDENRTLLILTSEVIDSLRPAYVSVRMQLNM